MVKVSLEGNNKELSVDWVKTYLMRADNRRSLFVPALQGFASDDFEDLLCLGPQPCF
jgi:hypothetical protein